MVNFKAKILGLAILVGMVCIGVFGVDIAKAAQALPKGGSNFETAVNIQQGSYTTDHIIAEDTYEYFKISVKAGQGLEVKFQTPSGGSPYAGGAIYNSTQEKLCGEKIIGNPSTSKTLVWAPGLGNGGTFYIAVGNEYDTNATNVGYTIAVKDYYDAGSETDAGATFDTAMAVTPGEYEGYLVKDDYGTDQKDLYKVQVAEGSTLTVTVTPPAEVDPWVYIYDSNRKELKSEWAPNKGAIVTISLPVEKTDTFFIEVKHWYYGIGSSYTLKISTEEGAGTDGGTDTTDGGTDTTTTGGDTATKGPNWMLIGGGALLLIGAVVLGAILLKKKSGSTSSPPTQPEQPSQ